MPRRGSRRPQLRAVLGPNPPMRLHRSQPARSCSTHLPTLLLLHAAYRDRPLQVHQRLLLVRQPALPNQATTLILLRDIDDDRLGRVRNILSQDDNVA